MCVQRDDAHELRVESREVVDYWSRRDDKDDDNGDDDDHDFNDGHDDNDDDGYGYDYDYDDTAIKAGLVSGKWGKCRLCAP